MKRVVLIILMAICFKASSQNPSGNITILDRDMFIINWEIAFPTNGDYLSETSFSNGRLEYRHLVNRKFAYGFSLGWYSFDQQVDQQLYESEDGSAAVFTDLIRQVYQVPLSANGYYYFSDSETLRPYIGLGLGANYSQQEAFFNIFVVEDDNWGFYVRPEIGTQYLLNNGFGLIAYVSFNYATNSSDFFEVDSLSHVGIGLGVNWSW